MQPRTRLALDQSWSPMHAAPPPGAKGPEAPVTQSLWQQQPACERSELSVRAPWHPPWTCQQHQNDTAKGTVRLTAAATTLLHRRAGVYFHAGLVFWGGGDRPHSVLDLRGHGHEGLLDVGGILCTGLQERYTQLVSILLHTQSQDISLDFNRSFAHAWSQAAHPPHI